MTITGPPTVWLCPQLEAISARTDLARWARSFTSERIIASASISTRVRPPRMISSISAG
jgi:hypothetical protein